MRGRWTDFERRALLRDPNQIILHYTRLQQGVPLVDEEEEQRLFVDFIQDNEHEMMNMREELAQIKVRAFDLKYFHRQDVQPVHRDIVA